MKINIAAKISNTTVQAYRNTINFLMVLKQLEMHGCALSTVATDGLVLKNQAISSTHSADQIFILLD